MLYKFNFKLLPVVCGCSTVQLHNMYVLSVVSPPSPSRNVFIGSPRPTPSLSLGSLTQRKQALSSVPSNFCHSQTPSQAEWEGEWAKAYRNVSNPGEKIPVLCHAPSLLTQHSCLILGRGGQQPCPKMRHSSHRWVIVLFLFLYVFNRSYQSCAHLKTVEYQHFRQKLMEMINTQPENSPWSDNLSLQRKAAGTSLKLPVEAASL